QRDSVLPAAAPVARVAGDVAVYVAPVAPDATCETVVELFTHQPDLFVQPVVDSDGVALGLLNRFRILERLSRRFGPDLYLRRAIVECLDGSPLLLDEDTPIERVGSYLFDGDRTHILDGFIVVRGGKYVGVGTGVTLARALSELTVARAVSAAKEADRA